MRTWYNTSLSPEERVDALLEAMSLEEKIHQLGSFWARDPEAEVPAPEPSGEGGDGHEVAPMENAFAADSLSWEESIKGGLGHLTRVWGTDRP